jgi:hypothetical protein
MIDRALRGRPRDDALKGLVVRFLAQGAGDRTLFSEIRKAAEHLHRMEREAKRLSARFVIEGDVALCDARDRSGPYDKTELLLLGQAQAPIALVYDETTVTMAARFDSGIDLVELLGLGGGMPTRVSVPLKQLDEVRAALRERELLR